MLFFLRIFARLCHALGFNGGNTAAGPDYTALFWYSRINNKRAKRLIDEWFPIV